MLNQLLRRDRTCRAALLVASCALLAASAGLAYVGYVAWGSNGEGSSADGHAGLPLFGLAAGVAWGGLFLLKRAVLPIHSPQDPQVVTFD